MTKSNFKMPQYPESYWRDLSLPSFGKLSEHISADIVIVGGGITGITAGYLLVKEGFKVAILEAGQILSGTTGHTTAKVTAQHGLIYDELISHFGLEKAKLFYEASTGALDFIRNTTKEKQIDCDFSNEDAFMYATSDEYAKKIEKELDAYRKIGINGSLVDGIPFDISTKATLMMRNQAQFHPLKYLQRLLQDFVEFGGVVYENTTATDIGEGDHPVVITRDGHRVKCKHVIAASHFPFVDMMAFYFARMHADRSYILGIKAKKDFPGGMYISADEPTRSLRYTPYNGEKLILVGGESHKTGQGIDTIKHYEALENFAEKVFGITDFPYRWSAQDLITLDKVAYIGPITSKRSNILVATGYRKWGMTNGTAAAMLLKDIILEKKNPYQELFDPARFQADPGIKKLISINTDVAGHLIKGKLEVAPKEPSDLEIDEGAVVMVNGKRTGAYKDTDGKLHLVDTTCTHLGCETEWNHGDRTWDCPCHGSRFSYNGEVFSGPAKKPLKKVDME
ncbi:FAD-dependent oxidoreductase [Bacillus sp. FJAT-29790]|uniref:FAD-dependent oxidoreductase n=1 Tax=Bacillus sp. FJAT-29790 TaxID=1895002 RepID=UPI001C236F62|nr:FAD-dependent oxidoreductase [Bacillus sp. FJAT-29790]MBU8880466.1 FAD-dependent oxidoreductase [Bacillus sp. FJAT-29790]